MDGEVESGAERRFGFGRNWRSFLSVVDEERICEAEKSIREFLGVRDLAGKSFLDIGSGSGLFSLAARRLGARVQSFDFDADAVACTSELKRRHRPDDAGWRIGRGSILDRAFVEGLGRFDVCYAWGVLHHTGNLWQALYNSHLAVGDGGMLFVAIYNDQGVVSAIWKAVKRAYCSGAAGRIALTALFYFLFFAGGLAIDAARLRNPARRYVEHKKYRGMSLVHDWKDWLGGYPYEVASKAQVQSFLENLGFGMVGFTPTGHGFGNNQFLFRKRAAAPLQ